MTHEPTKNPKAPHLALEMWVPKAARFFLAAACLTLFAGTAKAQLLGEAPLPQKKEKKSRDRGADLEWMWQYTPSTKSPDGQENELLQDTHFRPFLDEYFVAPQAFWGPNPTDPKAPTHKTLADTVYDFLAIPHSVLADENRYVTVTGSVFRRRTSRGLVFADLEPAKPLVVFAAVDWIRDSQPTDDPAAEYTLWIFPNRPPGPTSNPTSLPPALIRSLTRWLTTPVPGTDFRQKITHAILVDADGTPHEIKVPAATVVEEGPQLPKRPKS